MHFAAGLFLVVMPLSAQTFLVDIANGPGTNFTSLDQATTIAPDGSTLIVRPGTYGRFEISGKGLTLLGGPGVFLHVPTLLLPEIRLSNTLPSQSIAIRGFTFVNPDPSWSVIDCAGPVLIEEVVMGGASAPATAPITWGVARSAQVSFRNCTSWQMAFGDSNCALERCTVQAPGTSFFGHGLQISGGTTQLIGCTIQGGAGGTGAMAILSYSNSHLRVLAPSTLIAGGGPTAQVPAIDGQGHVRLDPAVVLRSGANPPIGATINLRVLAMPAVYSTSAPLGGTIVGDAMAPVGDLVILVLGLPGPRTVLSGVEDAVWFDPVVHWFAAIGVPQANAPVTAAVPIPNLANFAGLRIGWQSISWNGALLQASNPSVALVRY